MSSYTTESHYRDVWILATWTFENNCGCDLQYSQCGSFLLLSPTCTFWRCWPHTGSCFTDQDKALYNHTCQPETYTNRGGRHTHTHTQTHKSLVMVMNSCVTLNGVSREMVVMNDGVVCACCISARAPHRLELPPQWIRSREEPVCLPQH